MKVDDQQEMILRVKNKANKAFVEHMRRTYGENPQGVPTFLAMQRWQLLDPEFFKDLEAANGKRGRT